MDRSLHRAIRDYLNEKLVVYDAPIQYGHLRMDHVSVDFFEKIIFPGVTNMLKRWGWKTSKIYRSPDNSNRAFYRIIRWSFTIDPYETLV